MTRKSVCVVTVWMTALCVLVQSLGLAVGGVLCIGCSDLGGGLTLSAERCGPVVNCCAEEPRGSSPPAAPGQAPVKPCWCFDVPVTVELKATPPLQARLTIDLATWALPPVHQQPLPVAPACIRGVSRDGPLLVGQLIPSSRQTVLNV